MLCEKSARASTFKLFQAAVVEQRQATTARELIKMETIVRAVVTFGFSLRVSLSLEKRARKESQKAIQSSNAILLKVRHSASVCLHQFALLFSVDFSLLV